MYIPEIYRQGLLYYGIVDLVKSGSCASKSILKEDYNKLKEYMHDYLSLFWSTLGAAFPALYVS